MKRAIPLLLATLTLTACGSWYTSDIQKTTEAEQISRAATQPGSILITEQDLGRPYTPLGDIEVTVRKTTIFHETPTKAKVNEALQEEAAELGANAVILVRYGSAGMSLISWGELSGRGRAVIYK